MSPFDPRQLGAQPSAGHLQELLALGEGADVLQKVQAKITFVAIFRSTAKHPGRFKSPGFPLGAKEVGDLKQSLPSVLRPISEAG